MKISEKINTGKVTVSFELFPPKAGAAFEPVMSAAEKIASLKPDFMSVTYGRCV